jgi:hypothetical protein
MLRITSIVLACLFFTTAAEAGHHRHHGRHHHVAAPCVEGLFSPCHDNNPFSGARSIRMTMHRVRSVDATIVAHPAGCPRVAFCGCGAAVRLFGSPVRSLWLAANWYKFRRTTPQPGAAAVRRHHVMVLEADLGNGVWQVYDANSGHHATRIHARSIAGYTIVDPRA